MLCQLRAQVRNHQTTLRQLRQQLRQAEASRRRTRRRQPVWDDQTPLIRLVQPEGLDAFLAMIHDWEKHTGHIPIPAKSIRFSFPPQSKPYIIHALAVVLTREPPVFCVSTLQLCRYLSSHTNLGTTEGLKKALQRMKKNLGLFGDV